MAVLKVELPANRDIVISARDANLLLDGADNTAALLYIYILSHSCELDIAAAAKRLKSTENEVMAALRTLENLGLVGKSAAAKIPERSDEVPEYSQTDVAEHIGSDESFKYLAEFCENSLGKILSTVDLQVLLGIYSWLGLPVDVICLLITSCIEETRKKYGAGRVPTMRTIEKRAKVWVRDGVLTLGRAEEYLKEQEKLGSDKARISTILGISGRALAPTEERYISEWISRKISDELIAAAYDRTVTNTGSLKWSYMNKILTTWCELGFKTVSDVESNKRSETSSVSNSEDFDMEAALKLRELNRKKRLKREE